MGELLMKDFSLYRMFYILMNGQDFEEILRMLIEKRREFNLELHFSFSDYDNQGVR